MGDHCGVCDAPQMVLPNGEHACGRAELRWVPCETCGGSGEIIRGATPPDEYAEICGACDGTGRDCVEASPITGSDVAHWAWESWGHAFDKWKASLPEDHELHDADAYPDQYDAFFAAHPDGWALHPDTPKELIGTYLEAK